MYVPLTPFFKNGIKHERKWEVSKNYQEMYSQQIYILCNLQMGPRSMIFCPLQAFSAFCNAIVLLIGPICKLQGK
jgi:hypothetical protein